MKLIVGLGNIGHRYTFTRHNVGFMLADSIAINNSLTFRENSRLKCFMTNLRNGIDDYLIIKPTTFMNLSGESVRANGSDGGHNGIKSVIQHLGTKDIARLKIGIGPQPSLPSEVFVLQNFTKEELETLKSTLTKAKDGIECYFKEGIATAQNKFN